jgi:hypothetical protein
MENPLFECFSDELKEAVMQVVMKAAISRQGDTDGWNAYHMKKARDAVCDAAHELLEIYESSFYPEGEHIDVLQEEEVLEAQSNLLNTMSNSNNSNNNSNISYNSNNTNNTNSGSSNNNSSSSNNTNQNGGNKSRRRRNDRKTQRRRRTAGRKN